MNVSVVSSITAESPDFPLNITEEAVIAIKTGIKAGPGPDDPVVGGGIDQPPPTT